MIHYQRNEDSLRAAAEQLFGGQWQNIDFGPLNGSPTVRSTTGNQFSGCMYGYVTQECDAATKSGTEPDVVWTAGIEGRATVSVLGQSVPYPPTVAENAIILNGIGEPAGSSLQYAPQENFDGDGNMTVPVVNLTERVIPVDERVKMYQIQNRYCIVDEPPEPGDRNLWVKFRLTSGWNLNASNLPQAGKKTGRSSASVIASSDETIAPVGSVVYVTDQSKMFEYAIGSDESSFSNGGSIGWATKIDTNEESQWVVTECTQLVNKYKGTILQLPGNSATETVDVTITSIESVWPYIDNEPTLSEGSSIPAVNQNMFTANNGEVWIERRQTLPMDQEPTNLVTPYDPEEDDSDSEWVITAVEKPVARWVTCQYAKATNEWVEYESGTDSDVWEGYNPFDANVTPWNFDFETPPALNILGANSQSGPCLADGTKGIAFLDNTGGQPGRLRYIVCSTSSSLNGEAHEAAIVGTLSPECPPADPESEAIITVDGCEVKYKRIGKTWLFGNPASGASDDCCVFEEELIEQPFENWTTQDIVESVTVGTDSNGDPKLIMGKATINVCESTPTADDEATFTFNEMDVVNDVYCSGDSLAKDYKTIRFLGSVENSSSGVAIDTSCIEIDYTQIINYPDYPYIDYYHILWPDGCDPCPGGDEGCCTITYDSGTVEELSSSSDWCTNKGTESGVASTSFDSSGPCDGPSDCCCDGITVSGALLGTPSSYTDGTCPIGFTPTNLVSNGNCSWTNVGNWFGYCDASTPAGSFDLTYDDASSTWTISGTVPAPFGGSISGTYVADACGPGAGTPQVIDIPVSGTHSSMGSGSYTGTVRVSFTGIDCS